MQRRRYAIRNNLIFFNLQAFPSIVFQSIWFSWSSWRLHNEWAKRAILLILLTDACLLKLVDIQKQTSLLRDFFHWCLFPKTCWNWSAKKFKWQHLKIFVYFHAYLQLGIHCVQSCFLVFFNFEEANFGAIKMWDTWIFVGWIFHVKTEYFVYISSFVGIEWMFRVLHKKPP